jgi:hypothetical protein
VTEAFESTAAFLSKRRTETPDARIVGHLRWIVSATILLGYTLTAYSDRNFEAQYAFCTILSLGFFWILASRLRLGIRTTLPFWVLSLYLWIAYYLKSYWLAFNPDVGLELFQFSFTYVTPGAFARAFTTITVACAAMSLSAWLFVGRAFAGSQTSLRPSSVVINAPTKGKFRRLGNVALTFAVGLSVATTAITLRTGISVMGVEGPTLPYHLSGVVYLTRSILIPALLLLACWAALEARQRRRVILIFLVVVLFGMTEMLLRSSRGALAPMVLSIVFLLIVKGQLRRYRWLIVASAVLIVALHPLLSAYRNLRIHASDEAIAQLVSNASSEVFQGDGSSIEELATLGATAIVMRATGAEILIWYDGLGMQPLGRRAFEILKSPRGVVGYLTVDTFGFQETGVNAIAPGIVGWFYLLGGNWFVFLGLMSLLCFVQLLWKGLLRLQLRTEPVAQALFLTWLTLLTVDGVVESITDRTVLVWPIAVIACEWLARTWTGRDRITRHWHSPLLPENTSR